MSGYLLIALAPLYLPAGWDSLVEQPVWLALLLGGWVLTIMAGVWFSWRERRALLPGRWIPLATLRGMALLAIAVGMMGIERHNVTERVDPSRVVLLVDSSSSMRLPVGQTEQGLTRSAVAIELVSQLRTLLSESHDVRLARFGQAVKYLNEESESADFFEPTANDTRLGDALHTVLDDQAGSPLAAIVVLSDGRSTAGVDPASVARQASEQRTRIHTLGLGPLRETPQVELIGLTVPQRVFSGDHFTASALLLGRGGYEGNTTVQLTVAPEEGQASLTEERIAQVEVASQAPAAMVKFELPAPPPGRYTLRISLPDPTAPALVTQLESVDRKTSVLLVASGPTRDFRFLRDQLHRDNSFSVDLLLQSAVGAVSQDADKLLDSFPLSSEELDPYDAIVAFDPDWKSLGEGAAEALETWVSRQGGGLFFVSGVMNRRASLRQTERSPLARLMPVTLANNFLLTGLGLAATTTPSPVRLTPSGEAADFMWLESRDSDPSAAWAQMEGFYSSSPPAKPKTGATVYARLGKGANASPLLVEQFYGSGRVAYLASGETWRLRREDPRWFTSFHTKLLRHLSQGRLLGNSQGRLFFDQDHYEVGETVRLRLTLTENHAKRPLPEVHLLQRSDENEKQVEELTLAPVEGQPGSFLNEWPARIEGSYEASVRLTKGIRLVATTLVELPPRETANTLRDEATLRAIAEASGGTYYATADEALAIASVTPSRAETRTLLGPTDQEFGQLLARNLLLLAILALTTEWTLRRLWRLA